jgi:pimeloyl-ACP methyl ester carboxylesterase
MKTILKSILAITIVFALMIAVAFGYSDIPLEVLKEKYATAPSLFIEIDGMNVHYRDEGNPTDSIPIVLIHGTGSSLHTYDAWTEKLKLNHRVVRMDMPGFGLTGPFPERDYSYKKYVVFLDDFLKAKGISQFHLAGNSLGGRIAWEYTFKHPDKVKKLILIDASGYPTKSQSVPIAFKLAGIHVFNKLLTIITPYFLARKSVENVYLDKSKVTDALVDRYFELTLRAGNRQGLIDRMTMPNDTSSYSKISKIQNPTLLLWGANDLLIPVESAYRFHEDMPNDTLIILEQTGHVPMEESPSESLDAVISFLE